MAASFSLYHLRRILVTHDGGKPSRATLRRIYASLNPLLSTSMSQLSVELFDSAVAFSIQVTALSPLQGVHS